MYEQRQPQTASAATVRLDQPTSIAPREPNLGERAEEALGYLRELEALQYEMRTKMYGPVPTGDTQAPDPQSLEQALNLISSRSACLVGEMQSMLNRL